MTLNDHVSLIWSSFSNFVFSYFLFAFSVFQDLGPSERAVQIPGIGQKRGLGGSAPHPPKAEPLTNISSQNETANWGT